MSGPAHSPYLPYLFAKAASCRRSGSALNFRHPEFPLYRVSLFVRRQQKIQKGNQLDAIVIVSVDPVEGNDGFRVIIPDGQEGTGFPFQRDGGIAVFRYLIVTRSGIAFNHEINFISADGAGKNFIVSPAQSGNGFDYRFT